MRENQAQEKFVNLTKTWEKIQSNVTMKEFMILLMNFVSPSKSKDHQTKRDLILVSVLRVKKKSSINGGKGRISMVKIRTTATGIANDVHGIFSR